MAATIAASAVFLAGCSGGGGGHSAAVVAPYVDVSVAGAQLHRLAAHSAARELTLAFVIAGGRRCDAVWGGGLRISAPAVHGVAASEPVAVSFGGQDGPDLARWCPTSAALADQYLHVITRLHATTAEFDIEGALLSDRPTLVRRAHAIAALQARARASGRPIVVTLTLPVELSGLTGQSLTALRIAKAAGVRVDQVNLLAMDYGSFEPARTPGTMGHYAILGATAAARQLQGLLPQVSSRRIWRMIGVTTMIGRNDVPSEIFTVADAKEVARFARDRGIGRLSFWSLTRDRRCTSGDPKKAGAQENCSGVPQSPFEFARLFERSAS